MAVASVKYFTRCKGLMESGIIGSDAIVELTNHQYGPDRNYSSYPGQSQFFSDTSSKPTSRVFSNRYYAAGKCPACGLWHLADRVIFFQKNPSLHKCNAKCQAARGPNCECSCGGANHGSKS